MGGSLGPVLANIILTEFEQIIINALISSGIINMLFLDQRTNTYLSN